jgi:hypothetical protein
LSQIPRPNLSRKLLILAAVLGLSAFSLIPRPSAAFCECAPLGGEFCGADGRTYDSPCMAHCFHTTIVHSGPC